MRRTLKVRRRATSAAVLAAAVVMGAAACSGGNDSSSSESDDGSETTSSADDATDTTESPEGDAESDAVDVPVTPSLELVAGSEVELPAAQDSQVSASTPALIAFDSFECQEVLPRAGFDESYEETDLVAGPGNTLCLLKMAVTNLASAPITFSATNSSHLLTLGGDEYSTTDEYWNDQGLVAADGREPSFTTDEVQPNETKYDYQIYEIPADAEPELVLFDIATFD